MNVGKLGICMRLLITNHGLLYTQASSDQARFLYELQLQNMSFDYFANTVVFLGG